MKLTVLGKYGPFPAPGCACSGYLLEAGNVCLVLDMGSGTFNRLYMLKPTLKIDAVLLSHLHSDHMGDMLVLRYAIQQLKTRNVKGCEDIPMPLTVIAPESPESEFRQLAASGVYDMIQTYDKMRVRFGDMTVTFRRTVHPVPTFAMDIEHHGRRLFYTGDTGFFEELSDYCAGADLLLADTGFLSADKTRDVAPHLTAEEAGRVARRAGVGQLLCSHIWGGGYTDEQVFDEASRHFDNVLVAEELHEYLV